MAQDTITRTADTATLRLWKKLAAVPFGSRIFTAAVSLKAPYFRTALPHVVEMGPGRAVVTGPLWWGNTNHIGTFHVIAACNLAELAMGMVAEATVPPTHRWIPVGMTTAYPTKATGGLTVTAELEEVPDFTTITSGTDLPVHIRFVDGAGAEPITAVITIRVSPKK
ncbi:hotdog fold domain-containing protein [Ornithinimicrobium panacihumi]|uniref:hotdog fold domain-containing protein n=1 Tax=Ornithinimicrobium panacihumi TaxID=2008449 RepID=UPI003F88E1EE